MLSTPPLGLSTPPGGLKTPVREKISNDLADKIDTLGKRVNDETVLTNLIKEICCYGSFKSSEIAELLGKREDYIKRKFLSPMIGAGELEYLYPEMINHPEQAYLTPQSESK
ncbi:MAG: hypothetical protein ACOC4J_03650 [Bacteroidota bacterium]